MKRKNRYFCTQSNCNQMKKYLSFLLILFVLASCGKKEMEPTTFEKSQFLETDNYEGTVAYAKKLAKHFRQVNYEVIGTSGVGRDIPMLVVDENGCTKPEKIRRQGKAIVWVESCIHPGEPNGKDAMFMIIRDLLTGLCHVIRSGCADGDRLRLVKLVDNGPGAYRNKDLSAALIHIHIIIAEAVDDRGERG